MSNTTHATTTRRTRNPLFTPMPRMVRLGEGQTNDLVEAGVYSPRFGLSTNPIARTYYLEGAQAIAGGDASLVTDVFESEVINDRRSPRWDDLKWLERFLGDHLKKLPVCLRDAFGCKIIPVSRTPYDLPEGVTGRPRSIYTPVVLIAGFSTLDRRSMAQRDGDDRFFWPVWASESDGEGGGNHVLKGIILGSFDREDPKGGYIQGKHRLTVIETEEDAVLNPLDRMMLALFTAGWLERDSALLKTSYPDFNPQVKEAATDGFLHFDLTSAPEAEEGDQVDGFQPVDDEAMKARGEEPGKRPSKVVEPKAAPAAVKASAAAPNTLFGVPLPEGHDAKWCTNARCSAHQALGLFPKGRVICDGMQKNDGEEGESPCKRDLKVPSPATQDKVKPKLEALLAERAAAAKKAEEPTPVKAEPVIKAKPAKKAIPKKAVPVAKAKAKPAKKR